VDVSYKNRNWVAPEQQSEAHKAAYDSGTYASHTKKTPIRKIDMTNGAMTWADPHPLIDPVVTAKINRTSDAIYSLLQS